MLFSNNKESGRIQKAKNDYALFLDHLVLLAELRGNVGVTRSDNDTITILLGFLLPYLDKKSPLGKKAFHEIITAVMKSGYHKCTEIKYDEKTVQEFSDIAFGRFSLLMDYLLEKSEFPPEVRWK